MSQVMNISSLSLSSSSEDSSVEVLPFAEPRSRTRGLPLLKGESQASLLPFYPAPQVIDYAIERLKQDDKTIIPQCASVVELACPKMLQRMLETRHNKKPPILNVASIGQNILLPKEDISWVEMGPSWRSMRRIYGDAIFHFLSGFGFTDGFDTDNYLDHPELPHDTLPFHRQTFIREDCSRQLDRYLFAHGAALPFLIENVLLTIPSTYLAAYSARALARFPLSLYSKALERINGDHSHFVGFVLDTEGNALITPKNSNKPSMLGSTDELPENPAEFWVYAPGTSFEFMKKLTPDERAAYNPFASHINRWITAALTRACDALDIGYISDFFAKQYSAYWVKSNHTNYQAGDHEDDHSYLVNVPDCQQSAYAEHSRVPMIGGPAEISMCSRISFALCDSCGIFGTHYAILISEDLYYECYPCLSQLQGELKTLYGDYELPRGPRTGPSEAAMVGRILTIFRELKDCVPECVLMNLIPYLIKCLTRDVIATYARFAKQSQVPTIFDPEDIEQAVRKFYYTNRDRSPKMLKSQMLNISKMLLGANNIALEHGLSPETKEVLQSVSEEIKITNNNISDLLDQTKQFVTSVTNVETYIKQLVGSHVTGMENVMRIVESIFGVVGIIWVASKIEDLQTRALLISSYCMGTHILSGCIGVLISLSTATASPNPEGLVSQMFGMQSKETEFIGISFFRAMARLIGFTEQEVTKLDREKMKDFHMMKQGWQDLGSMVAYFRSMTEWIMNTITDADSQNDIEMLQKDIAEWINAVTKELPRDLPNEILRCGNLALKLKRLYETGLTLRARMATLRVQPSMAPVFTQTFMQLEKYRTFVWSKFATGSGRKRPPCILLKGKPGTGKSSVVPHLVYHLFHHLYPEVAFRESDVIFSRLPSTPHWDGYFGQFCTVFDDIFQVDDKDVRTRGAEEIIRCVNDASFNLPMAELTLKGASHFVSAVVIITQNGDGLPPNAKLQDPNAYNRRIDFDVEVIPDPDVCTRRTFHSGGSRQTLDIVDAQKVRAKFKFPDGKFVHGVDWDMRRAAEIYTFKVRNHDNADYNQDFRIREFVNVLADEFDKSSQPNVKEFFAAFDKEQMDTFGSIPSMYVSQMQKNEDQEEPLLLKKVKPPVTYLDVSEDWVSPEHLRLAYNDAALEKVFEMKPYIDHRDPEEHLHTKFGLLETMPWLRTQMGDALVDMKEKTAVFLSAMKKAAAERLQPLRDAQKFREGLHASYPALRYVEGALAVMGIASIGVMMYQNWSPSVSYTGQKAPTSGDNVTKKTRWVRVRSRNSGKKADYGKVVGLHEMHATQFKTQGGDAVAMDLIDKKITHALVKVHWYNSVTKESGGGVKAAFYNDRDAITVEHFVNKRPEEADSWLIETGSGHFVLPQDKLQTVNVAEDVTIFHVKDTRFPQFSDIRKHFAKPSDLGGDLSSVGLLRPTDSGTLVFVGSASLNKGRIDYTDALDETDVETITILGGHLRVSIPSEDGDCGSLYVVFNPRMQQKIIAMHVAGATHGCTGVGALIDPAWLYRDYFRTTFVPQASEPATLEEFKTEAKITVECNEGMQFVRRQPKDLVPRIPSETTLRESPIAADLGPFITGPAKLRPFKVPGSKMKVSPSVPSLEKYVKPFVFEPEPGDDELALDVANTILSILGHQITAKVLTVDEAINGVPGTSIHGLYTNTSGGFDCVEDKKTGGKRSYLICRVCQSTKTCECPAMPDFPGFEPTPDLVAKLSKAIEDILAGKEVETIWLDFLKDERVSLEKVATGKARIFSAAPLRHLILRKMYYGSLLEQMMRDPVNSFSAIGLNVHSADWGMLINRLCKWGNDTNFLPGDFKNYDASIIAFVCKWVCYIMDKWYEVNYAAHGKKMTDEERKIRAALQAGTYDGLHQFLDLVFRVQKGHNPSGDYFTIAYNNLVNLFIHIFVAVKCARSKGIFRGGCRYSPKHYLEEFEISVTGDDHVEATNNTWYTMLDKANGMAKFGMTYTDTKKRPLTEDIKWYTLEEVNYLKRDFVRRDGIWFAPMPLENIREIARWYRAGNKDIKDCVYEHCDAALREMFHHGEQAYRDFKEELDIVLIKNYGATFPALSWYDIYSQYFGIKNLKTQSHRLKFVPYEPKKLVYAPILYVDFQKLKIYDGTRTIATMKPGMQFRAQMELNATIVDNSRPTSTTDLTSYNDNEKPLVSSKPETQSAIPFKPYANDESYETMRREYWLENLEWDGALTSGTVLSTHYAPEAIIEFPGILRIWHQFQCLRWDAVKFTFRAVATPFHYGQLLFAWMPYAVNGGTPLSSNPLQNIYQASCCRPVILDASTPTPVTIRIPWVDSAPYFTQADYNTLFGKTHWGTVKAYVLQPLSQSNSTDVPSVTISVSVAFENPQVFGPIVNEYAFKAQMQAEQRVRSERHTLSAALDTFGTMMASVAVVPYAGEAAAIAKIAGALFRYFGYSKPSDLSAPVPQVQVLMSNTANTQGLDSIPKLAMDPENHIANDKKILGDSGLDYDLFCNYVMLPALTDIGEFNGTNTVGSVQFDMVVDPFRCHYESGPPVKYFRTHLAQACASGCWWRGSVKIMFLFCTSKFTTVRLRFYHYLPSAIASFDNSYSGDVFNHVVDVSGSTCVSFTVPYASSYYWSQCGQSSTIAGDIGHVGFAIVNPSISADSVADTTVRYSVWMSGGEDFVVSKPRGEKNETFYTQMDVVSKFRESFQPVYPAVSIMYDKNLMHGDVINRWTDLLKRYSNITTTMGTTATVVLDVRTIISTKASMPRFWNMVTRTFYNWRGSLRFKFVPQTSSATYAASEKSISIGFYGNNASMDDGVNFNDGQIVHNLEVRPVLECEMPMYSPLLYQSNMFNDVHLPALAIHSLNPSGTLPTFTPLFSVGNDFSIGWVLSPPAVTFVASSDEEKLLTPQSGDSTVVELLEPSLNNNRVDPPKGSAATRRILSMAGGFGAIGKASISAYAAVVHTSFVRDVLIMPAVEEAWKLLLPGPSGLISLTAVESVLGLAVGVAPATVFKIALFHWQTWSLSKGLEQKWMRKPILTVPTFGSWARAVLLPAVGMHMLHNLASHLIDQELPLTDINRRVAATTFSIVEGLLFYKLSIGL